MNRIEKLRCFRDALSYWETIDALDQGTLPSPNSSVYVRYVKGNGKDPRYPISVYDIFYCSPSDTNRGFLAKELDTRIGRALKQKRKYFIDKEKKQKDSSNSKEQKDSSNSKQESSGFDRTQAIAHLDTFISGERTLEPDSIDVYLGVVPYETIVAALLEDKDRERVDIETGAIATAILHLDKYGAITSADDVFELSPKIWKLNHPSHETSVLSDECRSESAKIGDELRKHYGPRQLTYEDLFCICTGLAEIYLAPCPDLLKQEPNTPSKAQKIGVCYYAHEDEDQRGEPRKLVDGYYRKDISEIHTGIKNQIDHGDTSGGSLSLVLSYLEGGLEEDQDELVRIDLLKQPNNPSEKQDLLRAYQEILSIDNTPAGRWPRKHQLALMQQAAVNLATHSMHGERDASIIDSLAGDILTVNGPPGTGKTTLLKDIIAANVVEKARLFAELVNDEQFKNKDHRPDEGVIDALFEEIKLDKKGGYLQYAPKVYRLKDDPTIRQIIDLGIIVCSSNNIAVENISTVLPDGKDLLRGLDDMEQAIFAGRSDDEVEGSQLNVIEWSTDSPDTKYRDLYFSYAADGQFGSSRQSDYLADGAEENMPLGALISARLGKAANIRAFLDGSLKHVIFAGSSKLRHFHVDRCEKARAAFINQFDEVQKLMGNIRRSHRQIDEMQAEVDHLISKAEAWKKARDLCLESHEIAKENFESPFKQAVGNISIQLEAIGEQYDLQEWNGLIACQSELCDRISRYREEREDLEKKLDDARNASLFIKGFLRSKYKQGVEQAENNLNSFDRTHARERVLDDILDLINESFIELKPARMAFLRTAQELQEIAQQDPSQELKRKTELLHQLQASCPSYFGEDRLDSLLNGSSSDANTAQLFNPLQVDPECESPDEAKLRRARDVLFLRALQFIRELVLSSKCINFNLRNLGAYLGATEVPKNQSNGKRINYSEPDRRKIATALFQTLGIITPVISTTFASVHNLFRDVPIGTNDAHAPFGLLIIDEAGQALPHAALGALARCNKAVIVGDPDQIQPVVTHDLRQLSSIYGKDILQGYKIEESSVQTIADTVNPFGSTRGNEGNWAGCPLLVHRRCISPMFEISNSISYQGLMLNKTDDPKQELSETFLLPTSQWINITGKEQGGKDHYVQEQGEYARARIVDAFKLAIGKSAKKDSIPDIFIISPFKSVVRGIRGCLKEAPEGFDEKAWETFTEENIGTVHQFQGKEANEVIFVLGCDRSTGPGAINFVQANIVNVAASRAKYRLYVIGDFKAWYREPSNGRAGRNNTCIKQMKQLIDDEWLKTWKHFKAMLDSADESSHDMAKEMLCKMTPPLSYGSSASPCTESLENCSDGQRTSSHDFELDDSFLGTFGSEFSEYAPNSDTCKVFGFESIAQLEDYFSDCTDENGQPDQKLIRFLGMGMFQYQILGIDSRIDKKDEEDKKKEGKSKDYDEMWRPCTQYLCLAAERLLRFMVFDPIKQIDPRAEYRPGSYVEDRLALLIGQYSNAIKYKSVLPRLAMAYQLGDRPDIAPSHAREADPSNTQWWKSLANSLDNLAKARVSICHANEGNPPETSTFLSRCFDSFPMSGQSNPPIPLFNQMPILSRMKNGVASEEFQMAIAEQAEQGIPADGDDLMPESSPAETEAAEQPENDSAQSSNAHQDVANHPAHQAATGRRMPEQPSQGGNVEQDTLDQWRAFNTWLKDEQVKAIIPSSLEKVGATHINKLLTGETEKISSKYMSREIDKRGRTYCVFTPEALEKWSGIIRNNYNEQYGNSCPLYTFDGFKAVLNFYAECEGIKDRV